MKINIRKALTLSVWLVAGTLIILSCKREFLDKTPVGQISEVDLNNKAGVNGLLIGAYSLLDGYGLDDWLIDAARTSIWNAWAGSVASDDAHKGGGNGSQGERGTLQNKTYSPTNEILNDRWRFNYAGVQRANDVLRQLAKLPAGEVTEAEALQITAEARFLRGVYHFELAKMFYNIPYVDETVSAAANNFKVPNSTNFSDPTGWDGIEEDFAFAIANLPGTQAEKGRAHSWAAKAFLAKVYMQRANLEAAKPILEDVIQNGTTSSGVKLALQTTFGELFRTGNENGSEAVFTVQMSVDDNAMGRNGNEGESFNYPPWIPGAGGWGHSPSFNLVNAYKTTGGLPDLDNYNAVNVKTSYTLPNGAPFEPETGTLDPRLDHTVGRRGLPYHDWGIPQQDTYIEGGPYVGKKYVVYKSELDGNGGELVDGWKINSGINYIMIRFADVLLMAAECEVEIGDLAKALDYVNQVRTRAANPAGFLKTYVNPASPQDGFTNTPAANYEVNNYTSFPDKAFARKAVRHERRLELATEGHRFFDLQRFDRIDEKYGNEQNYMARVLNEYMVSERQKFEAFGVTHGFLVPGATFQADKHEVYAIPQSQIDLSNVGDAPTLKQNPGH